MRVVAMFLLAQRTFHWLKTMNRKQRSKSRCRIEDDICELQTSTDFNPNIKIEGFTDRC